MTIIGERDKFNCLMEREGDVQHTDKIKTDVAMGRENTNVMRFCSGTRVE
jgi:hypothetical protein